MLVGLVKVGTFGHCEFFTHVTIISGQPALNGGGGGGVILKSFQQC